MISSFSRSRGGSVIHFSALHKDVLWEVDLVGCDLLAAYGAVTSKHKEETRAHKLVLLYHIDLSMNLGKGELC